MAIDAYISSAKKIHVTLLLLTITVGYFSWIEYGRLLNLSRLSVIDIGLAAQKIYTRGVSNFPQMARRDLPKVYLSAGSEQANFLWNQLPDKLLSESDNAAPQSRNPFDDTEIDRVRFAQNEPLRMLPGRICSVAIVQAAGGRKIILQDFFASSEIAPVPSDRMYLLNFSDRCLLGRRSIILIDARDEFGRWFLGLPTSEFSRLPDIGFPYIRGTMLGDLVLSRSMVFDNQLLRDVPAIAQKYIFHSKTYFVFPEEFLDSVILTQAQNITGNIYSQDQIQRAINDLFNVGMVDASLLGLRLDHRFLIRIAPVMALILTYVLYRRLRYIRRHIANASEPWLLLGVDNPLDRVLTHVWALSPAACVLAVHGLFADTQQLGWVVFGRVVSIRSIIDLHFPVASVLFNKYDYFAVLVLLLFLINMFFVVRVQIYIWSILRLDRRL